MVKSLPDLSKRDWSSFQSASGGVPGRFPGIGRCSGPGLRGRGGDGVADGQPRPYGCRLDSTACPIPRGVDRGVSSDQVALSVHSIVPSRELAFPLDTQETFKYTFFVEKETLIILNGEVNDYEKCLEQNSKGRLDQGNL